MTSFADLNLSPAIQASLVKMGYVSPSAIQATAIPIILEGHDLIALAQTGSGKTAASAIPICEKVNTEKRQIQALIVVPTRELALQYATETQKVGKEKGVSVFAMLGGEDASIQRSKLKHGVQVLIATPGRLIDFIYSREIDLSHVEMIILDEADEMLSMGFYDDLEFIFACIVQKHQTLLFSATMPDSIRKIAEKHMHTPREIALGDLEKAPSSLVHKFLYCKHDQRDEHLARLIHELTPKQSIVFCKTRHQVEKVCQNLKRNVASVDFLHAGMSQDIRSLVTNKFRQGKIKHLIATDVAARGLDFSNVTHVFIHELAEDVEQYVHRSGRTGRFDKEGLVISLVTDRELFTLNKVLEYLKEDPTWIGEPPTSLDQSKGRAPRRSGPPRGRKPAASRKPHS